MKFIKNLFLLILLIYKPITADYISAVVMLELKPSSFSTQLNKLFKDNKTSIEKFLGIQEKNLIIPKSYHMTLVSISLDTPNPDNFIDLIEKQFKDIATEEFEQAIADGKNIQLEFEYIQIFQKFVVAAFKNSLILQEIIQNIEQRLRNEIDTNIKMYHSYDTFIPHISLSKINIGPNGTNTKANSHLEPIDKASKKLLTLTYNQKTAGEFIIESGAYVVKPNKIPFNLNEITRSDYNLVNLATSLSVLYK